MSRTLMIWAFTSSSNTGTSTFARGLRTLMPTFLRSASTIEDAFWAKDMLSSRSLSIRDMSAEGISS